MRLEQEIRDEIAAYQGDKRAKVYKNLKEELEFFSSTPQEGLGDVVAKITKVTGIKAVVDKVSEVLDIDCGCSERQVKFNEFGDKVLYRLSRIFRGNLKDLNEEDYNYLCGFFKDGIPSIVSPIQQVELNKIYFNVSSIIKSKSSCSTCVIATVKSLYELYITYKPLTK
jgi:hypothetical protein